jgi:tetratricopeptide (TPR) repeat protein
MISHLFASHSTAQTVVIMAMILSFAGAIVVFVLAQISSTCLLVPYIAGAARLLPMFALSNSLQQLASMEILPTQALNCDLGNGGAKAAFNAGWVAEQLSRPTDAEAHYRTALTLLDRGRQEEGTTALDAALRAAPDAVDLLNLRARLARRQGQPEAAAALYARSLAAHPEQGSVLVELGDLAEADGDAPAANDAYRRAASLGSADGHYKLARSAAERGDWAAVRRELAAFEEAGGAVTGIWREEARALSGRAWTRFVAGWSAAGVGALVALGDERLAHTPATRLENACATGSAAIYAAADFIAIIQPPPSTLESMMQ